MTSRPRAGFAAAASADAAASRPSPDKLVNLKNHVRRARDLDLLIRSRDEETVKLRTQRYELLSKTLPDMFTELGIKTLELEPEGNMPAFTARAAPFYKANIAADWPEEKRREAFRWLREHKLGDLIKTEFVVELGRGTAKQQKELRAALKKMKIDFSVSEAVPHTTLTAVFKNMVEKEGKTPPLDVLGASMGTMVQVKESRPAASSSRRKIDGI